MFSGELYEIPVISSGFPCRIQVSGLASSEPI